MKPRTRTVANDKYCPVAYHTKNNNNECTEISNETILFSSFTLLISIQLLQCANLVKTERESERERE